MGGRRPRAGPRASRSHWLKVTVGTKVWEVSHEPFACSGAYKARPPAGRGASHRRGSGRPGRVGQAEPRARRQPQHSPPRLAGRRAPPPPPPHDARGPADGEELVVARGSRPGQRPRHAGQAAHGLGAAQVVQAHHGEEAAGADQRKPGAAQEPHPGRAQEGQLAALEAGEGRHPGDDRQASAQPAARPHGGGTEYGPFRVGQIPGRLQRVHERGDPLPLHLRGGEHRSAHPPAGTSGQLHESNPRRELPRAAAPARRPARALLRAAPGADSGRRGALCRQRGALQVGRLGRRERQGVRRRIPAGAGLGRAVRFPDPQRVVCAPRRGRDPPLRRRGRGLRGASARCVPRGGRPFAACRLCLETVVRESIAASPLARPPGRP